MFFRSNEPVYHTDRGADYTAQQVLVKLHDFLYNVSLASNGKAPPALPHILRSMGEFTKMNPDRIGFSWASTNPLIGKKEFRDKPVHAAWHARLELAYEGSNAITGFLQALENSEQLRRTVHQRKAVYEHYDTDTELLGARGENVIWTLRWFHDECLKPLLQLGTFQQDFPQVAILKDGRDFVLTVANIPDNDIIMKKLRKALEDAGQSIMLEFGTSLKVEKPSPGIAETLQSAMECRKAMGRSL